MKKLQTEISKTLFESEEEALEFVESKIDGNGPIIANVRVKQCREKYNPKKTWWMLDLDFMISDRRVRRQAELDKTVVLVTNLERPEKKDGYENNSGTVPKYEDTDTTDHPGHRRRFSDEEIVRIYGHEYKVEQSFRLMKSGLGMNSVFVQKPSRENAMMFVICIGVLLSNIADAMFRRADTRVDGMPMTMYRLSHELQTTLVIYSRCDNSLRLMGPPEVTDRFFTYTDTLGINPQLLLGYATG